MNSLNWMWRNLQQKWNRYVYEQVLYVCRTDTNARTQNLLLDTMPSRLSTCLSFWDPVILRSLTKVFSLSYLMGTHFSCAFHIRISKHFLPLPIYVPIPFHTCRLWILLSVARLAQLYNTLHTFYSLPFSNLTNFICMGCILEKKNEVPIHSC